MLARLVLLPLGTLRGGLVVRGWVFARRAGRRCGLLRAGQQVVGQLGVAGRRGGLLTVQAARNGVRLAAGAQGAGARYARYAGVGASGRSPLTRVCVHGGGDEVGAGAGHAALQVVRLRAAQGGGGAEVAKVVGTVDDGLLAALQRQEGALCGQRQVVMMVVVVGRELLLLEGLGVFGHSSHGPRRARELAVAAFAVGAAVAGLAPVAGFAGGRGHLGARREWRRRGERVDAGDPVRTEQIWPASHNEM